MPSPDSSVRAWQKRHLNQTSPTTSGFRSDIVGLIRNALLSSAITKETLGTSSGKILSLQAFTTLVVICCELVSNQFACAMRVQIICHVISLGLHLSTHLVEA